MWRDDWKHHKQCKYCICHICINQNHRVAMRYMNCAVSENELFFGCKITKSNKKSRPNDEWKQLPWLDLSCGVSLPWRPPNNWKCCFCLTHQKQTKFYMLFEKYFSSKHLKVKTYALIFYNATACVISLHICANAVIKYYEITYISYNISWCKWLYWISKASIYICWVIISIYHCWLNSVPREI